MDVTEEHNILRQPGQIRMKNQVDFTQGNIVWAIVRFSIPLILGEPLQNLYNSADALVAGNLVDQNALAAVTVCSVIANLVVNFLTVSPSVRMLLWQKRMAVGNGSSSVSRSA